MEREVKIVLVPKEQIYEEVNMYRISCNGLNNGWGKTLEEAMRDFDESNKYKMKMNLDVFTE